MDDVVDEAQREEDKRQVEMLQQSSPEDLAVDLDIEQPSQDATVNYESDERSEG